MENGTLFERLRDTVRTLLTGEEPSETPTFLPTEPPACAKPELRFGEGRPLERPGIRSMDVVVGGVVLPRIVAEQLRQLGVNFNAYSHGELTSAVEGCAVDCRLVDDEDGVNFVDRLRLTPEEREARITRAEPCGEVEIEGPHSHRLRAERVRAFAHSLHGPPGISF